MTEKYTYTTSTEFINSFSFDYVETYSFQRGKQFHVQQKKLEKEYEKLKKRKSKLTIEEEERLFILNGLCGQTQYLLNETNQLHYSNIKTSTFSFADPKTNLLKSILNTEIKDIPSWMCGPIYRDAFVFYDKEDKIVSVLNICLSCEYMETMKFNFVNGDYKTYELLKIFFINIGHDIED